MRLKLDQDLCISAGRCALDEPKAFDLDDDELVVMLPAAAELSEARMQHVADRCPSGAISLVD